MNEEQTLAILNDQRLRQLIFEYRVASLVRDNVRADPEHTFEALLLAHRGRHLAAERVAQRLMVLLEDAGVVWP